MQTEACEEGDERDAGNAWQRNLQTLQERNEK